MIKIVIGIIIVSSLENYNCKHFGKLSNMGLKRNRPPYERKPSFWPPVGIIILMLIVVRARSYNYNYKCDQNHNCKELGTS